MLKICIFKWTTHEENKPDLGGCGHFAKSHRRRFELPPPIERHWRLTAKTTVSASLKTFAVRVRVRPQRARNVLPLGHCWALHCTHHGWVFADGSVVGAGWDHRARRVNGPGASSAHRVGRCAAPLLLLPPSHHPFGRCDAARSFAKNLGVPAWTTQLTAPTA